MDRRWLRAAFFGLLGVHLVLIWTLDVFPAQDLPQHLAIGRILMSIDEPGSRFAELYAVRPVQSYFVTHYVLAWLGKIVTLSGALRVLLSLYAIGIFYGFAAMVASTFEGNTFELRWAALLATVLVWNPILMMGFLSFAVSLPFVFLATAWVTRSDRRATLGIGSLAAIVASLHVVAAALLVAILIAYAVRCRTRDTIARAAIAVVVALVVQLGWATFGAAGLGGFEPIDWATIWRNSHGIEGLDKVLRIKWSDPLVKVNYAGWALLGPYRNVVLIGVAAWAAVWAAVSWWFAPGQTSKAVPLRWVGVAVLILALLAPWGLYVPSEVTFLDFRIFPVAVALLLATTPSRWFVSIVGRAAVVSTTIAGTLLFAFHAYAFQREARRPLALMAEVPADGVLMSLPLHDRSAYFAHQFRVTHFLPMYFCVERGGINTQFWAGYTHHLPIEYREGRRLRHTTDWRPHEFAPEHVLDSTHVIVERPSRWSKRSHAVAWTKIEPQLERVAQRLKCEDRWCLYVVRKDEGSCTAGPC